jgi:multidrug efflux pump subunit AcrA (membrane-fusion protein)
MRLDPWHLIAVRCRGRFLAAGLVAALAAAGCGAKEKSPYESVTKPPTVRLTQPRVRTIVRTVGQPSFIEAYERTSVYPKVTAYIDKWIVDIGDKVKKGDVLAKLFVPELVEDFATKKAIVTLDTEKVELAKKRVEVASANVKASAARLDEAKSILGKYEAEVVRWDTEVARLKREVQRGVVDPQILLESTNQSRSATASRDAAKATIRKAEAELFSDEAALAEAKVNVAVAQADVTVATSDAKRLEAWVGYLTLTAPYNGVIVARNANTFDFVLPATGDPTADARSPHLSPSGNAAPIYVVDRTDIVRIFVDVPEQDANYVQVGSKATVLARAYRDQPISASVTRTSWALNVKSRTLRAEIDLPNPGSRLLPGMYAYAKVHIERPGVLALPVSAITYTGDKTFCWLYENGRAARREVRTGISDGESIEVTDLQRSTASRVGDDWAPVTGSEKVILGDLSILADGGPVEIAPAAGEPKIASGSPEFEDRTVETASGALARAR